MADEEGCMESSDTLNEEERKDKEVRLVGAIHQYDVVIVLQDFDPAWRRANPTLVRRRWFCIQISIPRYLNAGAMPGFF